MIFFYYICDFFYLVVSLYIFVIFLYRCDLRIFVSYFIYIYNFLIYR